MVLEIVVFCFLGFLFVFDCSFNMFYDLFEGNWGPHLQVRVGTPRTSQSLRSSTCNFEYVFIFPSRDCWKAGIINIWPLAWPSPMLSRIPWRGARYVSHMNTFAKAFSTGRIINDNDGTQTQKKCNRSMPQSLQKHFGIPVGDKATHQWDYVITIYIDSSSTCIQGI